MSKLTGVDTVRKNFAKKVGEISGGMTEKTVTQVLIAGGKYAAALTPVATSNLINSSYRDVKKTASGYEGRMGFGANYAEYVHNAKGVLLGTNTPRYPKSDGNVWDPDAEPQFLVKGFERDGAAEIQAIIKQGYRV
ncbi:MAG: hypothetical protein CMH22_15990 [Methylophaga sp.]|nr:hypothetical protein [Methylophaga sp.]MAX53477.1 hypothetical protein [Methylophaga sp.]|tara:strand:- start:15343 stop:15750 length:408 start_codon:yes stop_codon:yes gene_type:complete